MLSRSLLVAGLVGVLLPATSRAEVKTHPIFSPNMVLQRDQPITVWGTADPQEEVTVLLQIQSASSGEIKSTNAFADAKGNWSVSLPAQPASKPGDKVSLKINKTTLDNVLIGDVWLCSGQSNMEWRISQLPKDDQAKKVAAAATHPTIRLFDVPNRPSAEPMADFPVSGNSGKWLECKPETAINFSAVGYFFGRKLNQELGVPIGLISSDWGGTPAEAWTNREFLNASPSLKHYTERFDAALKNFNPEKAKAANDKAIATWKEAVAQAKKDGKPAPRGPRLQQNPGSTPNPTTLYNGMIAPITKFPITGAIWYQGESNAGRAYEYRTLMPTMIQNWRKQWGKEFPFFMVQLAPFRGGASGVDYAELRDAQFHTTKELPKVGIAIITDVGDETDIHPQQKQPVGERLAQAALHTAYGKDVEPIGPTFKELVIEGNKAVVRFNHLGGGLTVKGSEVEGFQLAGVDGKYHPAQAEIKGDTVVVTCDAVTKPVSVRYGWVNFAKPTLNLSGKNGLPAAPFRTDDQPYTTKPKQ